jgi:hypothetical protein
MRLSGKLSRFVAVAAIACMTTSCGAVGGDMALEDKPTATPSSNPGDVVVWDPNTTVSTTTIPTQVPAEERDETLEPLYNIMGLNKALQNDEDLAPYMQNSKTMTKALDRLKSKYKAERRYEIKADSFQKLPKDICAKMRAGDGCVEISFYILLDGQPATPLIKTQVTPGADNWLLTEYGLCKIMATLSVSCGIDVGSGDSFNPAVPNES